jgi:hypothetical protein
MYLNPNQPLCRAAVVTTFVRNNIFNEMVPYFVILNCQKIGAARRTLQDIPVWGNAAHPGANPEDFGEILAQTLPSR